MEDPEQPRAKTSIVMTARKPENGFGGPSPIDSRSPAAPPPMEIIEAMITAGLIDSSRRAAAYDFWNRHPSKSNPSPPTPLPRPPTKAATPAPPVSPQTPSAPLPVSTSAVQGRELVKTTLTTDTASKISPPTNKPPAWMGDFAQVIAANNASLNAAFQDAIKSMHTSNQDLVKSLFSSLTSHSTPRGNLTTSNGSTRSTASTASDRRENLSPDNCSDTSEELPPPRPRGRPRGRPRSIGYSPVSRGVNHADLNLSTDSVEEKEAPRPRGRPRGSGRGRGRGRGRGSSQGRGRGPGRGGPMPSLMSRTELQTGPLAGVWNEEDWIEMRRRNVELCYGINESSLEEMITSYCWENEHLKKAIQGADATLTPDQPLPDDWISFYVEVFGNIVRHTASSAPKQFRKVCSNWPADELLDFASLRAVLYQVISTYRVRLARRPRRYTDVDLSQAKIEEAVDWFDGLEEENCDGWYFHCYAIYCHPSQVFTAIFPPLKEEMPAELEHFRRVRQTEVQKPSDSFTDSEGSMDASDYSEAGDFTAKEKEARKHEREQESLEMRRVTASEAKKRLNAKMAKIRAAKAERASISDHMGKESEDESDELMEMVEEAKRAKQKSTYSARFGSTAATLAKRFKE